MPLNTLIVITGPTASGKSALAIEVARALSTDVISADSRQIFRGIPIVSAVTPESERRGIKHHLLEVLDLEERYSASEFENDSLKILDGIFMNNNVAVVCGGSMMYIDALCNGIDDLPTIPEELRNQLAERHRILGDEWVRSELRRIDPVSSERVDPLNMRRVIHALEISIAAGRPASELLIKKKIVRPFKILKFALTAPRAWLFDRINRRVDEMVAQGLEEEAKGLFPMRQFNSLNTVGLKELFQYFDGKMQRDTAIERIKKNTRVYAKKQMTWLKKDNSIIWLDATSSHDELVHQIIQKLD